MSKFPCSLFFIFWLNALYAQTPFLVKDINQTIINIGNSTIMTIAETDNFACFFADDGRHGNELWITDGTPYGTRLLKDIFPGQVGSGSSIVNFCRLGDELYFPIKSGSNFTPELWKTDGTPEGTVLVTAGPFAQEPEEITALGNKILFKTLETDGGPNYILWVSDGTATGTRQIKKFDLPYWQPFSFTPYQNGLIFSAGTKDNGVELWKTDGTTNGTVLVKDIYPGSLSGYPGIFTVCKDKVYFRCTNPNYGNQIWMTDGTESGTMLLKQLTFNSIGAEPTNLKALNDSLYFVAFNQSFQRVLWVSDGSENNTLQVQTSMPGQPMPGINGVFLCDSFLITTVFKGNSWELWRKNGADGTYFKIKTYNTSDEGTTPNLEQWISADNHFFFSYRTSSDPTGRLWITDGTDSGTRFLKNISPPAGYGSNNISGFSIFANDLYFSSIVPNFGLPLWKSDGTNEGTHVLKDIKNENNSNLFAYLPQAIGDTLFFTAQKAPLKNELWRSMGSGKNTSRVAEIEGNVSAMSVLDGFIYLTTYNQSYQWGLWKYNTTGTHKTELFGGFSSIRSDFYACNGKFYFSAETYANGREPWVTDGTPQGTKMLMDINPGANGSIPESYIQSDTHLFFIANNGITGSELWALDLVTNVPSLMKDIIPGNNFSGPLVLGIKGGKLYFIANRTFAPKSTELWKSDGTSAGTILVGTLPLLLSPAPTGSILFNDHFYFAAEDENHGKELWRTDGTIAGTTLIKDINASPGGSDPYGFCIMDSSFLFYAYTPQTGLEPWRSDGSTAGTTLIKDLNTGVGPSDPHSSVVFYPYKDKVYFSAQDSGNQQNLWVTNGSPGGTNAVFGLDKEAGYFYPGNFFSTPSILFNLANAYFNQKGYGEELWSLRWCNDSILSLPVATDISFNHQPINDTTSCRCNIFGELMDKVVSSGVKPITGKIQSKVWIEENAPKGYVNKVFEILPVNQDSLATGLVTLYYSQEDFDAFNQVHDNQLPANPLDSAGIKNLYIELRKGGSKNGSGLPVSFIQEIETLQPESDQIRWDSVMKRWEIEIAVTGGFGGFFVKADSCMLSESFTWRGSNSEDWDNENNWLEKAKPSIGAEIIIPSYRRFYPLISQNVLVRKLQLEKGAILKVNPGVVIDINEKVCR